MAISYVGAGTFDSGTTSCLANYPAGAASDVILALIGNKPFSSAPSVSGYTSIGTITSGSVANSASTGSVRATAGLRNTSPTSAGGDTVSVTSGSPTMAIGLRFATSVSGVQWTVSGIGLADTDETLVTVSATGTFAADQLRAGDVLVISVVIKDDAPTHSTQLVTISGITHGGITWLAKQSTTSGNDGAMYLGYCDVTAGSSTGSATYSATSSVAGASAAAVNLVRLREITPTPTGLTATTISSSQIDLAWTAVSAATSYTVERSPDGSTGWSTVGSPTTNSYSDIGLTDNTTYYYRVTANSSVASSVPSSTVSATTWLALPFLEDFASGTWPSYWTPSLGAGVTATVVSGVGRFTFPGNVTAVESLPSVGNPPRGITAKVQMVNGSIALEVVLMSTGAVFTGYRLSLRTADLKLFVGSTQIASLTVTSSAGVDYRLRLEVLADGTIRGRRWLSSGTEPSTWDLNVTDTTLTSGGLPAVMARETAGGSGTVAQFDDINVYDPTATATFAPPFSPRRLNPAMLRR